MTSTMFIEKQLVSIPFFPTVPHAITEELWEEESNFLRDVQPQNHDHVH